jgi:hypothetical protein
LEIALNRIEYLDFELFGVEPRDGSNELDCQLEASHILARIAAIEGEKRFIPRLSALEFRFGLKGTGCGIFSRIEALDKKVLGESPSQPLLVRIAALEAFKSPLSAYQGLTALRGKVQGIMPSRR